MYSNALPELYPEPHDVPQGWGLTFFLHLKDSAVHSEGTGWWAGRKFLPVFGNRGLDSR